jgi:hypothetical protein
MERETSQHQSIVAREHNAAGSPRCRTSKQTYQSGMLLKHHARFDEGVELAEACKTSRWESRSSGPNGVAVIAARGFPRRFTK